MSNAIPLNDQTFLGKFRQDLEAHGIPTEHAHAIVNIVVNEEQTSSMAGRWMDDPAGYPAMMYNVLWMLVKTYALTYIDKHAPQAWFRPVFLPVAEQTKFLEKCRKEDRRKDVRKEDPSGLLYKKSKTFVGRMSSSSLDSTLGITEPVSMLPLQGDIK